MIKIDFASAKMSVDKTGVIPAVTVGQRFVSAHLTQGFITPETPPDQNGPAFFITGEVDVLCDSQNDVNDILNRRWIFNFVQICKVNANSTTWTGRTKNEGEVSLIQSEPPAFPAARRFSLDANNAATPFVNNSRPTISVTPGPGGKIKVHVKATMGDHPNIRQLKTPIQNRVTHAPNFMLQLEDDSDFFTVFTARDDKGVLQPALAHVHWRVALDVQFRWHARQPVPRLRIPLADFDPFQLGPPTDPRVSAIAAKPAPPHTKELLDDAGRQAVLNRFNLQESKSRSLLIPTDFFS